MRIYVQWTTSEPGDWTPVNVTSNGKWKELPSKPQPRGGEVIDAEPGWVHAIMCQGVSIQSMDHYHVARKGSAVVITAWNDDPEDWPEGRRWAQVWTFDKPRPDPKVGGRLNTRQFLTVYHEDDTYMGDSTTGGPVEYRSWADFTPPTDGVRHGIWTPDDLNERHFRAQKEHGWREWAD